MRRLLSVLLATAALSAPAAAQVVKVEVGGDLAARVGETLEVPVTVDMRGAPGLLLGAFRIRVTWDRTVLQFSNIAPGSFGQLVIATDSVFNHGVTRVGGLQANGAGGVITLFTLTFGVLTDTLTSPVAITVEDLTAAGTFANLAPMAQVTNGIFCRSLGRWGDTNDDGRADSRDALIALSHVVGLIGPLKIDTLSTTPLVTDTTLVTLADVDGDGTVTSRDALIILSNSVGLPVTGYRIGLTAAGSCATGAAATLVILPDTLELQAGQRADVLVQARDAAGRIVPTPALTWRTSDATVAAAAGPDFSDLRAPVAGGGGAMMLAQPVPVEGRAPGSATITAEAGPGISTTMVVQVVARRRVWHANVQAGLDALTQTGTTRYPFGRVGDAMRAAANGDTIRVAPGVYQETPSQYKALTILGDPANRPILDPRGSGWTGGIVMYTGNPSGKATVAHLVFRAGGLYLEGHDNEVRRVRFEGIYNFDYALEIYSDAVPQPTGPVTGPPGSYGNVLIDSVEVQGFNDHAIVVNQADTVVMRNTTVTGDSTRTGCFFNALAVYEASVISVHDNVFSQLCQGLELWTNNYLGATARIMLSRNRIDGFSGDAMELASTMIELDHTVIRNGRSQSNHSGTGRGIYVRDFRTDSVSLLGDSIVNVPFAGIYLDSAGAAFLDSVTVDGTGQDSSFGSDGISLDAGRLEVRHSRVRNVINGSGISFCDHTVLRTLGNTIRNIGNHGVQGTVSCFDSSGPDSLLMDRDTIDITGGQGVTMQGGSLVRLDSIRVDSAISTAITLSSARRVVIAGADLRRSQDGMQIFADTLTVTGTTVDLMANYGLFIQGGGDTARISNSNVNAANIGIALNGVAARLDSVRITNHLQYGVELGSGAGARIRRSRLSGNGLGIVVGLFAQPSFIHHSMIAGNVNRQGARNDAGSGSPLDADTNWWGDAAGPACAGTATGCNASPGGDSILTADITFANPLAAPPAVPAPPALVRADRAAVPVAGVPGAAPTGPAPSTLIQPEPRSARRLVPRSRSDQGRPRD